MSINNKHIMDKNDFKAYLVAKKEDLRGKCVGVIVDGLESKYTTLEGLGNRILEVEEIAKGFSMDWKRMQITVDTGIDMAAAVAQFKTFKI